MAASTPAETRLATRTTGSVPPMAIVWPSCDPTRATSPTVLARLARPVRRAAPHAAPAPATVTVARWAIATYIGQARAVRSLGQELFSRASAAG